MFCSRSERRVVLAVASAAGFLANQVGRLTLLFVWFYGWETALPQVVQDRTITLTGMVTDSVGAAIADAQVMIHWDPSGSQTHLIDNIGLKRPIGLRTDARGGFAVQIPPGFYDVFVSKPAFTPECRKLRIKKGILPESFRVTLRVDALVVGELGERIVSVPKP